jgi:hypothetical protein
MTVRYGSVLLCRERNNRRVYCLDPWVENESCRALLIRGEPLGRVGRY